MVGLQTFVDTRSDLIAGQSQRDGKFENSLNFKIVMTCIGALYVENG